MVCFWYVYDNYFLIHCRQHLIHAVAFSKNNHTVLFIIVAFVILNPGIYSR